MAVLANPSDRRGTRTERQVDVAAAVLLFDRVRITNIFAYPSPSSRDILTLGREMGGWILARSLVNEALAHADGVLVGFGGIPVSGPARLHLADQLRWLSAELQSRPSLPVWQVGSARHPSRWHQFVSDRHGRTSGGSFRTRLTEVIQPVPVDDRVWAS
ncbi:hypothetical protein K5O09_16935 [Cellulomonas sp. C5510]|nr:hypothetical protein K5O09_16935 [Cellulomonas sp. C5510]